MRQKMRQCAKCATPHKAYFFLFHIVKRKAGWEQSIKNCTVKKSMSGVGSGISKDEYGAGFAKGVDSWYRYIRAKGDHVEKLPES